MHTFNIKLSTMGLFFAVFLSILVTSCSSVTERELDHAKSGQPGDVLYLYLSENVNKSNSAKKLLVDYSGPKRVQKYAEKYNEEIAQLFTQNALSPSLKAAEEVKKVLFEKISVEQASALFALYPIDTAKWMKIISTYTSLTKNDIYESAITAGLDPSIVFAASASGFEDTATPLINSIGLVIYGQDEESTAAVKFRADDDTYWREGLDLAWEPIYGSFAGSIVYLEANTTYHIEVTITDVDGDVVEHTFQTTTKPNTPPIDPNKIYYLSEIYSGGQLDLEALNIEGSADGYAKIIGDGPVIEAGSDVLAAVDIGNNSYIMLENLTVKGGQRYGIFAKKAHHIWIKGCNVSEYGREAVDIRNGKAYSSPTSNSPINYDSGIYLERSGIAVIEECEVHSPNLGANNWSVGHPKGANALQVWAYHDSDAYRGEFIVRNNRFYGTANHRFNDVIEGRMNTERRGGFVRNSAIYGNYIAYANDDLIEIDGGQQNVLVYNNELTQGYVGISIAPNLIGPSYLFHNYIHDLGDDRGKEWTAIKAGGLLSKPAGKTYVIENYINTDRNGIAGSSVAGDSTFWIEAYNNIILNRLSNNAVGLGIYDKEKFYLSKFVNNLIFNTKINGPKIDVDFDSFVEHYKNHDEVYSSSFDNQPLVNLSILNEFLIPNFTREAKNLNDTTPSLVENKFVEINEDDLTKFDNQTKYGLPEVKNNKVTLVGNSWYKIPIEIEVTKDTMLTMTVDIEGSSEIVGIALESNNSLTQSKVLKLGGSQKFGNDLTNLLSEERNKTIEIEIGKYHLGPLRYIVFILDNDKVERINNKASVSFSNIVITNLKNDVSDSNHEILIPVGKGL